MGGAGLDLLEIERIERALARWPGLSERLFSSGERAYAASQRRPARHLAARLCAKEAVLKALELELLKPLEIEVLGGGSPTEVRLHGAAAQRARERGVGLQVSLTHTRTLAGAVAFLS